MRHQLILLFSLLGFSFAHGAESPVQQFEVVSVQGLVKVRPAAGADLQDLAKGARLGKGVQIRGAPGARAILKGADGSRVKLEGESVLEVMDWGTVREFKLDRGMAMFQAAPGPARSFLVRTRAAVMGVRGTQFFVSYAPSGGDEWMCVKEGEVEISPARQEQSLTLVKAGQGVRVEGSKVTAPEKFAWTEKLKWGMEEAEAPNSEELLKGTYDDVRVRNYD